MLLLSIANLTAFANATVLSETQFLVQPSPVALPQDAFDAVAKGKASEKKEKSAKKDAKTILRKRKKNLNLIKKLSQTKQ